MDTEELIFKSIESDKDVASTLHFLERILSHKIDHKIWEWEFNSFPKETILTIINNNSETVGTQFMLPIKLNLAGKEGLSGKCENSYFDDRYRGQGLFQRLFEFASDVSVKKTMKFLWAFTPAIKVYENKLGFSVFSKAMFNYKGLIGKPTYKLVRLSSGSAIKAVIKLCINYFTFLLYKLKWKLNFGLKSIKRHTKGYLIKNEVETFADIDVLYTLLRERNKDLIHIKISEEFFDWRIKNNVNLNYLNKYFYKNGQLKGYYTIALKGTSGNISDFTFDDDQTAIVMMNHLLSELSKKKMVYLNYFGNFENKQNKHIFSILKKLGGKITLNEGMPFVYKDISGEKMNDKSYNKVQNWYLNGLWTEGFTY